MIEWTYLSSVPGPLSASSASWSESFSDTNIFVTGTTTSEGTTTSSESHSFSQNWSSYVSDGGGKDANGGALANHSEGGLIDVTASTYSSSASGFNYSTLTVGGSGGTTTTSLSSSATSTSSSGSTTFGSAVCQTSFYTTVTNGGYTTSLSSFTDSYYVTTTSSSSNTSTSGTYQTITASFDSREDVVVVFESSSTEVTVSTSTYTVVGSIYMGTASVLMAGPEEVLWVGTGGPGQDAVSNLLSYSASEAYTLVPSTTNVTSSPTTTGTSLRTSSFSTLTYSETLVSSSTLSFITTYGFGTGTTTYTDSSFSQYTTETTQTMRIVVSTSRTTAATGLVSFTSGVYGATTTTTAAFLSDSHGITGTYAAMTEISASTVMTFDSTVNPGGTTTASSTLGTVHSESQLGHTYYASAPVYDNFSLQFADPIVILNQPAPGYRVSPLDGLFAAISLPGVDYPPPFFYPFENGAQQVPGEFPVTRTWEDGVASVSYTGSWSNGSIFITTKTPGTGGTTGTLLAQWVGNNAISMEYMAIYQDAVVRACSGVYIDLGANHSFLLAAGLYEIGGADVLVPNCLVQDAIGDGIVAIAKGAICRSQGGGLPYLLEERLSYINKIS
jgi:hypothetical protein